MDASTCDDTPVKTGGLCLGKGRVCELPIGAARSRSRTRAFATACGAPGARERGKPEEVAMSIISGKDFFVTWDGLPEMHHRPPRNGHKRLLIKKKIRRQQEKDDEERRDDEEIFCAWFSYWQGNVYETDGLGNYWFPEHPEGSQSDQTPAADQNDTFAMIPEHRPPTFPESRMLTKDNVNEIIMQILHLGIYTLQAEKVPILLGMRTMERLGAVIDVVGILVNIDPSMRIPLQKSTSGHLLVNLTCKAAEAHWLKVVQAKKQAWLNTLSTTATAQAIAKSESSEKRVSVTEDSRYPEMGISPGRKMVRRHQLDAEQEYQERLEPGDHKMLNSTVTRSRRRIVVSPVLWNYGMDTNLCRFKSSTCWIPSIRKKVSKPKKLVGFGVELMYYQVDVLGGEVLQEWLRWNKAWKFRVIQQFWDHCAKKERSYAARIDGCAYGASCKEGLTSWRQRWRWCKPTTSPTPSGFMRDKFWNDELYGNTTAVRSLGCRRTGAEWGGAAPTRCRVVEDPTSEIGRDAAEFLKRCEAVQEAIARGLWTELPAHVQPELLEVYVTHLTNDDYVVGAEILAASLAATGTTRPLVALVTAGLSAPGRAALRRAGWLLLEVGLAGYEGVDTPQARGFFSKIWLWALPFHKVIYIDTDILVLRNLDTVFQEYGDCEFAAAPDSQPHMDGEMISQTGFLVLRPCLERFSELWVLCSGSDRPMKLDDWKQFEQGFFTIYFDGGEELSEYGGGCNLGWRELPAEFNFTVRYCKRPLFDGLTPLTAAVVHFACAKPWDWGQKNYSPSPYVKLYLEFAKAAGVVWKTVECSADRARDRVNQEKMREIQERGGLG
ncbi:unnamed protein product [Effrenium voratum]|nr:unnamed protein product [Effrenium voratum]